MNINKFALTYIAVFFFIIENNVFVFTDDDTKISNEKTFPTTKLDPTLSAEAEKKFPANQWVMSEVKINIPEKWNSGRYLYINSYSSIVYCESLSLAMTMDGYTYTPSGKAPPNNYSDSVYTFDPIKNELELFKRSNWRAGARSGDPEKTSFPLDENKLEPTPCPRHLYKGITWHAATNAFYLINGANAGVPNEHPKYLENNGTDTKTFWMMDVSKKTWKLLENPPLKRIDRYDTILTSIPGTNKLIYLDDWSIAAYDTLESKWTLLLGNNGKPVKPLTTFSSVIVDSSRQAIIFYGGISWTSVKGAPPQMAKNQLCAYSIEKNSLEVINGTGAAEFEKTVSSGVYLSNIDKYLYLTEKGHFLYDPTSKQWKKLKIEMPKIALGWTYMTYDTKRGLVILNDNLKWAVLRLDEKTLTAE